MQERTWEHNEIRIRQMWPNAQWGDTGNELRAIFKKHLSGLMQNHLYAAIDEVKVNFSSHQPELKWFISAYDRIVDSHRKFESGATRAADKWWVDYERPSKHTGLMYKFSTDAPDLKSATAIAASTGGRVRNYTQVIEQDSLVHHLKSLPRADIAAAIGALRARGMMSKDQLPSDISQWRPATVGFVTQQLQQNPKQKALT